MQPSHPKLRAAKVNFYYGAFKALHDISLDMQASRITALIGPSGCGKSTFLRTLNRINETIAHSRVEGQILLDNEDVLGVDVTSLRRRVGMVFQRPNPFPSMTIAQNVLAGLRLSGKKVENPDALVKECLERAGLWREARNRLNEAGAAQAAFHPVAHFTAGRHPVDL